MYISQQNNNYTSVVLCVYSPPVRALYIKPWLSIVYPKLLFLRTFGRFLNRIHNKPVREIHLILMNRKNSNISSLTRIIFFTLKNSQEQKQICYGNCWHLFPIRKDGIPRTIFQRYYRGTFMSLAMQNFLGFLFLDVYWNMKILKGLFQNEILEFFQFNLRNIRNRSLRIMGWWITVRSEEIE